MKDKFIKKSEMTPRYGINVVSIYSAQPVSYQCSVCGRTLLADEVCPCYKYNVQNPYKEDKECKVCRKCYSEPEECVNCEYYGVVERLIKEEQERRKEQIEKGCDSSSSKQIALSVEIAPSDDMSDMINKLQEILEGKEYTITIKTKGND